MMKRYGKSLHDIFTIKQSFIDQDRELVKENLLLADIARQQPKRQKCKNCLTNFTEEPLLKKHEINYYLCQECNHLNGEFEDTNEFAQVVYVDEVTDYSKNYSEQSKEKWNERVRKIYNPKAEYLLACLDSESKNKDFSVLDIGAGSGYFLKALMNSGFKDVGGYEVSEKQVQLANTMLEDAKVEKIEIDGLVKLLSNTESEVVSMIGVLEHLINPREILKAISYNKNIKYYFLSLPLFSFSTLFELNNETHFNRHLAGGHTHLYTKESIQHFCKEFEFKIIGEWFFGTDAMDLYRFNLLKMIESTSNQNIVNLFSDKFLSVIDEIQLAFDKEEFSSEVHILLKN
jgi:2-polyprenyl-3-methyl-5-hydroxy-6-metoxy-1,4-benzoquinol methylase